MKRMKASHPSAALFVGILLAFSLPFGYSAQACGPSTREYRGVDLLRGHVQPDYAESVESREFAAQVARRGIFFGWLLGAAAMIGLFRALFRQGRLWATWCAITAALALVLGLAVGLADTDIGWELAFFVPLGGVALKILFAFARLTWRGLQRLAPVVTTPDRPGVR